MAGLARVELATHSFAPLGCLGVGCRNSAGRTGGASGGKFVANSCQRKVEMSGFSQDRNVRFHGLLQG